MAAERTGVMPLRTEADIIASRHVVRQLTIALTFSLVDQTKMITAVSELSRNTVVHGHGGAMRWEVVENGTRCGLRVQFEDQGPGIPDLDSALQDGWTTGGGMGLGLPGSKRLVHEFAIESQPGNGTLVTILRWK